MHHIFSGLMHPLARCGIAGQRAIHILSAAMKSFRQELWFEVPRRRALLNLTPQVEACLRESGIREGLCLVNARYI